jgi:phosphatidylethanolamine/phosphatidyl-N-methylethanolamine N-methyltransferase
LPVGKPGYKITSAKSGTILLGFILEISKDTLPMLRDLHLFAGEFLKTFTTTGAIAPSSPALARSVLKPLRQRADQAIRILEVGPGTGAFTFRIIKQLRPGDELHIYELNPRFYRHLQEQLAKRASAWPGVTIELHNRDIRTLKQAIPYDYIVSGLPLTNFDARTIAEIMELFLEHLSPAGVLSYFDYILPHQWRMAWVNPKERDRIRLMMAELTGYVFRHQTGQSYVWWNLPPARARYLQHRSPAPRAAHPQLPTHR